MVILAIIFELGLELSVELVAEVLVELGFHSTAERLSGRKRNLFVAGAAYAFFGSVLGALSLYVLPLVVIESGVMALIYFVLAPLAAGFGLSFVSWIINRGIRPVRLFELQKFVFGVLFASSFSWVRTLIGSMA